LTGVGDHEIENMKGRQFRMLIVTKEPGGVFGLTHDHKDTQARSYSARDNH